MKNRHDSSRWTGAAGTEYQMPEAGPLAKFLPGGRFSRPPRIARRSTAATARDGQAALLVVSVWVMLWIAGAAIGAVGPGEMTARPPVLVLTGVAVLAGGFLFRLLIGKARRVIVLATIGLSLSAGIVQGMLATLSSVNATPSALQRAQLTDTRSRKMGHSLTFALADGRRMTVERFGKLRHRAGSMCIDARVWKGRYGFEWLKVEASSPLPARGGLSWPIAPVSCFGATPLDRLQ